VVVRGFKCRRVTQVVRQTMSAVVRRNVRAVVGLMVSEEVSAAVLGVETQVFSGFVRVADWAIVSLMDTGVLM
jgi:hypothetical protein